MINGLYILLLVILFWIFGIISLAPKITKSKHFSLLGPALMVKSVSNRGIIDRIAKKFPGVIFGRISVAIVIFSALLALALLIYGSILSLSIKPSNAPSLSLLVGLPGINPAIPITFGLVAIILAVAIHEIFHGVVARRQGIKLTSVGALFFVIPVGAFVEPDEHEIMNADPVIRRRVIAAGPGINIVIALISLVLVAFLLVPAASPVHQGLYIESSTEHSPFAAVIPTGTELISVGNSTITYSGNSLVNLTLDSHLIPGKQYNAVIDKSGNISSVRVYAGMTIASIISGFPADNSSVPVGSVILSIGGQVAYNDSVLSSYLDSVRPGSVVNMTLGIYSNGSLVSKNYSIVTTSAYRYYSLYDPAANSPAYRNYSFIGISTSYFGISGITLSGMQSLLSGKEVFTSPWTGMLEYISLPFAYLSPIPSSMAALFSTPFNSYIFWGLVNTLYWLFWMDFLLGITNALPLFILDGGQFFRDTLYILSRRKAFSFLRNENNLRMVTSFMGFVVLLLFMWEIIVPRII